MIDSQFLFSYFILGFVFTLGWFYLIWQAGNNFTTGDLLFGLAVIATYPIMGFILVLTLIFDVDKVLIKGRSAKQ